MKLPGSRSSSRRFAAVAVHNWVASVSERCWNGGLKGRAAADMMVSAGVVDVDMMMLVAESTSFKYGI